MAKPAILTVDDDEDVLRSVTRDLKSRYGREYRVLPAESGAAALDLLEQLAGRDTPVALILSDQRMPRMDGVALLSRTAETHPRTKRLLLTAYADTDAAMRAINESRLDHYLLKPWDPPEEKLFPVLDDKLEDWRSGWRQPWARDRSPSRSSTESSRSDGRVRVRERLLRVEANP